MNQTFDIDDLVWAKFKNYRPWPGRIIRETLSLKPDHLCVQFYGNDDHSQVLVSNIHPYLERVDEFTSNIPKNYGSGFYTAINTIHEKYWNLVDLKRDSEDSGFPVDTDEEIEMAIEDRKAGNWNPRVLRRPLPQKQDDDDDSDDDDDDYPDSSWGRSKHKRLKKDKKGALTKQMRSVTDTKNSSKKTRSKTETSCQTSKATTSKASTSGQSSKTVTSCQNTKASCQSKAKSSPSKTTSSSVSLPVTKRQKSIHLLRSSTQETTCQNIKASPSKVINTHQVNTRKGKSTETLCLSKEETTCQNINASPSKVINTHQVNTRKGKSTETLCLSKEEVKPSTSKTFCSNNSGNKTIAPEAYSSPFEHFSLRATPAHDVIVPQAPCRACKIKYGFIGLKKLSQSIIYPLLKCDHIVNVWSKDASKFNALTKAGAVRKNTPAGIITSSDVIFYCTRDPDITKNILLTREGVFDGCARSLGLPKIFVELTNIDIVEPERSIRPLIKFQGGYYLQVKAIIPQINEKAPPNFICAGDLRVFAAVASCLYYVTRDIHYFGSEFFKDAPMEFTPTIVEELVLQSLQKTTSFLYEIGFKVPEFEKILCHENFEFGKVVAKLKECNEAKRNKEIEFYQNM